MSFQAFAISHGLIIDRLEIGKWTRVGTVDHPHSKNGSYIYDGYTGAIQNWAVHLKPVPYFSGESKPYDSTYSLLAKKTQAEKIKRQESAARKVTGIMRNVVMAPHPYLVKKGFPEEKGWVLEDKLIIPMRLKGSLVGCQQIDRDGNKKFLYGQVTKGASCVFDNKGANILVEGYATALSVRRALKSVKQRYTIHVCFSAGNIIEIAKQVNHAFIVSDNDNAGLLATRSTKLPYWVSDVAGEDFNDYELRVGPDVAGFNLSSVVLMEKAA